VNQAGRDTRPRTVRRLAGTAFAAGLACAAANAVAIDVTSAPADAAFFRSAAFTAPAGVVDARQVLDVAGRHILVLTRVAGPSREQPNPAREERIDLRVAYYSETPTGWAEEWTIRDFVDCPELDSAADFLLKGTTVTDLDRNGMAEVTVSYTMFCGGGVDPSALKVIMRQGNTKFALRGETELRMPGQAPAGGGKTADKALSLPENAAFKRHLDKVWSDVQRTMRSAG
jgi:hypothetical protein